MVLTKQPEVAKFSQCDVKVREGRFSGGALLKIFTTDSSTRVKDNGRPIDSPSYQPTCAEFLPHLDILFNVLSMQANTRSCLKVLTVLQREALVEVSALGIRGRRRNITSDFGLL